MSLSLGAPAPDFDVTASDGRRLRLSELRGKPVVLFFYPGDFTTVCTKEACGFRDQYADLAGRGAELIGVSSDDDDSHRRFAGKFSLKYPLVADTDHALAKKYDVFGGLRALFGKNARVTYIIDGAGRIAGVVDAALSANDHVDGVRDVLAKLA